LNKEVLAMQQQLRAAISSQPLLFPPAKPAAVQRLTAAVRESPPIGGWDSGLVAVPVDLRAALARVLRQVDPAGLQGILASR
jgi:hypothetical protein